MDVETEEKPTLTGFLERLRWLGRLFLLLFVLGAAAFLSAITAMRFAIEGRVVGMPDVVGKNYSMAVRDLGSRQLGVRVADHSYSGLPVDDVVRQSPPPGTQVKVGQMVQVVLSLGPQKVTVPNLVDQSLPAARLQLLTAGLQLGEVSYIYSSGEPANLILQQHPLPGESQLAGPRVSVLVSLGPRPPAYLMPSLAGMPAAQAQSRLTAAGLQTPKLTMVNEPGAVTDSVVGQTPSPGALVDPQTTITLQVASEGPVSTTPGSEKPGD
ncbi:MAG: PASTA domain-containing protein [Acidobacteriota bacterium]|nr:PASTA domain-containing protein [Acidobacteriota bacterium]